MKIIKKLKKWEHSVEKKPRSYTVSLVLGIFVFSLITGVGLARQIERALVAKNVQAFEEMKQAEYARLDEKIENLQNYKIIQAQY